MKKLNSLLVFLICFSFASYASEPPSRNSEEQKRYQEILNSKTIKECEKNGGIVEKAGIMGLPQCVINNTDAGKPCKNSSECSKSCLLMGTNVPIGTAVTGECQHTNLSFGCYAPVENGIAGPALCVD